MFKIYITNCIDIFELYMENGHFIISLKKNVMNVCCTESSKF